MKTMGFDNIPNQNSSFKFCSTLPLNFFQGSECFKSPSLPKKSQGGHVILKKLTINLLETLHNCNPNTRFDFQIPCRNLTIPNEGKFNHGFDNENHCLILKVNDIIVNQKKKNDFFVVIDSIGQGSFGQVFKCHRQWDNSYHAIKIIKNLPVYHFQAILEIQVLDTINQKQNSLDSCPKVVKLVDKFGFKNHVCLVFPLLHINLLDFLKETKYQGLQMDLIRQFVKQILEGTKIIHDLKITHCDLKPENILLESKDLPSIQIIDLGSALSESDIYHGEIQSLFYRAPEIIFGLPRSNKIDMWSIGCIAAELYLGMPLFNGTSSFDQLKKIIEFVKMYLIHKKNIIRQKHDYSFIQLGKQWQNFLKFTGTDLVMKTKQEFEKEKNIVLVPENDNISQMKDFEELRYEYFKSSFRSEDQIKLLDDFVDFLQKILTLNPHTRISSEEALNHPFIKQVQPSTIFEEIIQKQQNDINIIMNLQLNGYKTKNIKQDRKLDENNVQSSDEVEKKFQKYHSHSLSEQTSIYFNLGASNNMEYQRINGQGVEPILINLNYIN